MLHVLHRVQGIDPLNLLRIIPQAGVHLEHVDPRELLEAGIIAQNAPLEGAFPMLL